MSETSNGSNVQSERATGAERPLLEIKDLQVGFNTQDGLVKAVDGVNITLYRGQSLAIVGESGSGKSTTAHAIINLLPGTGHVSGGQILLDGQDLTKASKKDMEGVRGRKIGFVPQDPMSNLNPVWSIGFQVEEAIKANGIATGRKEVKARAVEVLKQAGLGDADRRMRQFPHQFSGGMRQRVLIGMGLAANPQLLIADEPTSALDVTVQRVILDHLESLTRELGTTLLFITHDLGLAAERAEQLVVMYKGRVVESGPSVEILQNPQHPYTLRLFAASP
ncbi:MAG: ABC transporter ATP-binding protein, partial [Agromyces sp.]